MKKILAIALALVLCFGMVACSGSTTDSTATASKVYKVGVVQLMQHVALDAATQGFQDALIAQLGEGAVDFDVQNASGESVNCATIVNGFVSDNVDLIMANATPALQAAASATDKIPVLATSITDYATALELTDFNGTIGTNVSGTCDLAPIDQQAEMLHDLFPDAKTVGLLYCSAEPNSVFQADMIETYLTGYGYEVSRYTFTDSNDVSAVSEAAAAACDVLYVPTDNTAATYTESIANKVLEAKTPLIAGEEGICSGCGVATLTIDYYDLGYQTGLMAAKILTGEADVSTMAIEYAPNVTKKYNAANCEQLGITVPEDYVAIGD